MSGFTAIELEKLPEPSIVEVLNFSAIKDSLIADFKSRATEYDAVVESDPAYKLLEVAGYINLLIRARINDALKGNMLAKATGSDLEHLAALYGLEREVVDPGDPDAIPPIEPTYETDTRLRHRSQLALEGFTTAGSEGSYVFHTLNASPRVKDVDVYGSKEDPGHVIITVLGLDDDGTPDTELLETVEATLSATDVRPLTDFVTIQPPEIIHYTIQADLFFYSGPDPTVVKELCEQKITEYVTTHHLLGHDITLSGIYAALHQTGVQRVNLNTPSSNIVISRQQAAYCTEISVNIGGIDE